MRISETYYRKNLPHIHPNGYCFFITANLKGAIAKREVLHIRSEYRERFFIAKSMKKGPERTAILQKLQNRYFEDIDEKLDHMKNGPHWLKNQTVAEILADQFHKYDGTYYNLLAYTIMSNHFHLLIDTKLNPGSSSYDDNGFTPLHKIMKRIKGASACYSNRQLNRTGQFWRRESYDRYIRDGQMLNDVMKYIVMNPVKAGLVNHWTDYQNTYVKDCDHVMF